MLKTLLGVSCTVFVVACGNSNDANGVDASGPGSASDAQANSDVADIPGIVLWLDAAKGVSTDQGKVTLWADQSSHHNDASQQNANWQPALVAQGIHGLPSVHFTAEAGSNQQVSYGTMLNIADSATLQWASDDYLIEVVTRYDNTPIGTSPGERTTGYGTFYSKQTQTPQLPAEGVAFFANTPAGDTTGGTTAFSSYVFVSHGVTDTTTGLNDGVARLLGTQRTAATTLSLRVNGAQTATNTVPSMNVDEVGVGVCIGASGDATIARLDGDVAEMIVVKGAIAATDLQAIETYLTAKYGL